MSSVRRCPSGSRELYAIGTPVFSVWFHVLDPQAMAVVHVFIVVIAALFTLGFCTRITSALVWFGTLSYTHRNPSILFGVDTMINILLIYLMLSPCGAVYSIDRLIRKWWVQAKPGVVLGWYRFWKLPAPATIAPAAPVSETPEPSVAANVAKAARPELHRGTIGAAVCGRGRGARLRHLREAPRARARPRRS